jgi:hypothetical protein
LNEAIYSFASKNSTIQSILHYKLHYDCIWIEPNLHHLDHLFAPEESIIKKEYLLIDFAVNAELKEWRFHREQEIGYNAMNKTDVQ